MCLPRPNYSKILQEMDLPGEHPARRDPSFLTCRGVGEHFSVSLRGAGRSRENRAKWGECRFGGGLHGGSGFGLGVVRGSRADFEV